MGNGARTLTRVVRAPLAERDLRQLWRYIARDDDAAADRVLTRIMTTLDRLAEYPLTGSPQPALGVDIRSVTVGRYRLFYQPIPDGIRLIRVLHGARDVPGLGVQD